MNKPHPPSMLAVSEPSAGDAPRFEDWVAGLDRCGVAAIEVRDKTASDRRLYELARVARTAARRARVLINRRADIALATSADGVHLPHDGFPIDGLRSTFPAHWLYGRSTHSSAEVAEAEREGADYVIFGPVYPTPSKPGAVERPRLEELSDACSVGVPVLAIGGVALDNLGAIASAGAHGIAAIRYFADLDGLEERVRAVQDAFSR